jgi:PACS-1 cytosolic sorting protein
MIIKVWLFLMDCNVQSFVSDVAEVASRIVRYLSGASHVVQLMLAEAIITNKEKGLVFHATRDV